jgi:molybdopterin-containing oxidoreductase family membrane subunit
MGLLVVLAGAGLWYTYLMYDRGLYFTGMKGRVPWGLQIIMAVFYIGVSAGSLVISSLYTLFGKSEYKPFARISAFLATLFLVAALLSIILDWGRPDQIFIPFQYFNPTSMFALNTLLYSAYIVICLVYLWAMFKQKEKLVKIMALIAVVWAIGVHSGTGAIFGFVPRELYRSSLVPPSFIAAAVSSGTALMILLILMLFKFTRRTLDRRLIVGLGKILAVFVLVVMYFIFTENAFRAYIHESREAAFYYLFGGTQSVMFWVGLILVGSVIPAVILFHPRTKKSVPWIAFSSVLVVLGIFADRYLIVVPGQTYPPEIFPNMTITSSALEEGTVNYAISFPEVVQALGIMAIIGFVFVLGLKLLRFLPLEAKMSD